MVDRKTVCMFDLENTLIDSWHSGLPILRKIGFIRNEINKIRSGGFIHGGQELDTFGLFSFAIDRDFEKAQGIDKVPEELNVTINPDFVPCFEEIEQSLRRFQTDSLNKWEVVNLFGKDIMFPMWALSHPTYDFILFDDAIPHPMTRISRELDQGMQSILMIRV